VMLRERSMRLPHTQPQSGMVKPVIGAVIARRWLRLGNGRRLIASIHRPHRTGRDWTSAVVIGRKTTFIYGVDAIQSLSLAVVYLGKALERIRRKIRRNDRWLTELFPILVPNLPPDLPAKVDRLIEKETKAQLRRFEARAKKPHHRRRGTKRRED
jgi:hypothetical protein